MGHQVAFHPRQAILAVCLATGLTAAVEGASSAFRRSGFRLRARRSRASADAAAAQPLGSRATPALSALASSTELSRAGELSAQFAAAEAAAEAAYVPAAVFFTATTSMQPMGTSQMWMSVGGPPMGALPVMAYGAGLLPTSFPALPPWLRPTTTVPAVPNPPAPQPTNQEGEDAHSASVPPAQVTEMRSEIAGLREEVARGNTEMWQAVRLITNAVDDDEQKMKALTKDVLTLRGRRGGGVQNVATECTMRQASSSDCLSAPCCVWCKVEQRCYSGDSMGPVHNECALFDHSSEKCSWGASAV
mmetsp:Transcript_2755/g.4602  ORF Transcript_2755/g.4602 Transcript_2755/m.4602 type:complete len:304 (-) Transcript_2755:28-939(-)